MDREITAAECAGLLAQLIGVNTAQPAGNEAALCEFIEKRYAGSELRLRRLEHGGGRASLLVEAGPAGAPATAFFGHLDTVASGPAAAWDSDPFTARFDGDTVYGRGAADMKGGVAAMLLTLDRLGAAPLARRLVFCFTADEESGGLGARAAADSGALGGVTEIFVCEPSAGDIGLCEKGALWLRLTAEGRSCHASRPELGDNAAEKLMRFLGTVRAALDSGRHALLGGSTASLTGFQAGVMTNIVPAHAEATLDIRTLPSLKNESLLAGIRQAAGAAGIGVEVLNDRPPLETPADDSFVGRVRALARQADLPARDKGIHYYTDASLILPKYPVPFVIFGPGDDAQCHTANERGSAAAVAAFARVYLDYIKRHC
ncbi:MAG: M20/M25/M40 family metallo-hydrolase [Oscillospiraceae bacterium]|nr:M20/M25/M40 family metallo-hydrolase [Oscillospiraceae bacterium]